MDRIEVGAVALSVRIRETREMAGVSLADAARRAGISYSYLSDFEDGRRLPSLEELDSIAVALGDTVVGLLKGIYPWDNVQPLSEPAPTADGSARPPAE